jgi:hypothetical protein
VAAVGVVSAAAVVEEPGVVVEVEGRCHGYDIKDQPKGRVRTGEPGSPEYYCHGPYPGALLLRGLCGSLFLRGLCGSLFLRGLCGSLFLPQWLSPSGTNKSVASVVWLSRQRRNPAATDTYQSQAQTQSEGRVAVCQSERSAQLNFISPW